jgi:hypothetical protein
MNLTRSSYGKQMNRALEAMVFIKVFVYKRHIVY